MALPGPSWMRTRLAGCATPAERQAIPRCDVCRMLAVVVVARACMHSLAWPELDENTPCGLCYTSGTIGNPKVCSSC
jgi:fatty-acyl-CoA synthase